MEPDAVSLGPHFRKWNLTPFSLSAIAGNAIASSGYAGPSFRPIDAMRHALLALCLLSPVAMACDTSHLALSGVVTVPTCSPKSSTDCVLSNNVVFEYMKAMPDDPTVMNVGMQTSPWRMYDGDMRILTVDDVAAVVRANRDASERRIDLIGSWTGVSPAPGVPSLADRLSKALDGFPVRGEDGFLWLSADGKRHTTRQAYTGREGAGSYFVPKGADVMVALAGGWPAFVEGSIPDDEPDLLMRAAAGWDIFYLCPDRALASFEHAAAKGSAIAAYNAAVMRLERNSEGDRAAARALLERAAALGDAKSRAKLAAEGQ